MPNLLPPWNLPLGQLPTQDPPGVTSTPVTTTTQAPSPEAPPTRTGTTAAPATSTTATSGAPASQPGNTRTPSMWDNIGGILPLIAIVVFMYLFMFRGQRKQEKQRKQMVAEMKKGDRVMTIGGLIGRVVSIDNDEVVIKIDESANVKATYKKASIQQVLVPGDEKPK